MNACSYLPVGHCVSHTPVLLPAFGPDTVLRELGAALRPLLQPALPLTYPVSLSTSLPW